MQTKLGSCGRGCAAARRLAGFPVSRGSSLVWQACTRLQHQQLHTCRRPSSGKLHTAGQRSVAAASAAPEATRLSAVSHEVLSLAADLPIRECLQQVLESLDANSCLVLQAPPGAGKTTVVPLALLCHNPSYLGPNGKVMVLEPRRVAAKAAARRMAAMLGERVGETVGYRVKLDTRVGPKTRIEVVTSGILIRMLQQDPGLEGVGAVLFDEFHERNLDSDLALTLSLDAQQLARPELRLVVMSATLGGGLAPRLSRLMSGAAADAAAAGAAAAAAAAAGAGPAGGTGAGSAAGAGPAAAAGAAAGTAGEAAQSAVTSLPGQVPIVVSEGRSYPVAIKYVGGPQGTQRGQLEEHVCDTVLQALKRPDCGDVLVFLPGVGEIRNVERLLLRSLPRSSPEAVLQLHGNQAPADQDAVIRGGGRGGPRRIILSTPIAESSVTIDGVRTVVDSGLRRSPAYDTQTGVNRLKLTSICEASAEQRAGRAGRTAPGTAYRLWDQGDVLRQSTPPEIVEADMAPLVLELALWGATDGSGLPWLDAPESGRVQVAIELLQDLGALDAQGKPTEEGRRMARFGVHPRFAHMVLRGEALGAPELAAVLAAVLSERDVLRGSTDGARTADLAVRLRYLAETAGLDADLGLEPGSGGRGGGGKGGDGGAARRALQSAAGILQQLQAAKSEVLAAAGGSGNEDGDGRGVNGGVDGGVDGSEDEGYALDDEEAASTAGEDVDTGNRSSPTPSTSTLGGNGQPQSGGKGMSGVARARDFHTAWTSQTRKEGLVGALLAIAYPDRIARQERGSKFKLADGRTATLPISGDPLGSAAHQYLAVAELGGHSSSDRNDRIYAAAALTQTAITRYLSDTMLSKRRVVVWASASKRVVALEQQRLGALVVEERAAPASDEEALPALVKGFREMGGLQHLGLPKTVESFRQRVCWLRRLQLKRQQPTQQPAQQPTQQPTQQPAASSVDSSGGGGLPSQLFPDLSDEALVASAAKWLRPYVAGVRTKSDLAALDWQAILHEMVGGWQAAQRIEDLATPYIVMPTGTKILVDYSREQPVISVKIQEAFGMLATPTLAGGAVPILMELLSPAGKPLQVTADLAGFWKTSYDLVRRDMKGRYPRHYWPEDPSEAEATKMTKKQMEKAAAAAAAAQGGDAVSAKAGAAAGPRDKGGKKRKGK